jgi:tetratricopeptide (TPR) repeat protein
MDRSSSASTALGVTIERRRLRWLAYLAVTMLVSVTALGLWQYHRSARAAAQRDEALQLCEQGQFQTAEPLLRQCLERDPSDDRIFRALVLGYQMDGRVADAGAYLTRWCEAQPGLAEPHILRSEHFSRTHEWDQASAEAKRILEMQPNNLKAMASVVSGLNRSGQFAAAEVACQQLLERRPQEPALLYQLAESQQAQGKDAEAAATLDRLLSRVTSESAAAWTLRGILYSQARDEPQAIRCFRQALAMNANDDRASYHLCLALTRNGQLAEAEKHLEGLIEKIDYQHLARDLRTLSGQPELQIRMARRLFSRGRTKEGRELVNEVLAQHPDRQDALELLRQQSGQETEKRR